MRIAWDGTLSVGHADIDRDHHRLVDLLNRLADAVHHSCGDQVIGEVLCELADYTRYHFDREEHVMQVLKYRDRAKHIELHANLIEELTALIYEFEIGQGSVTRETLAFLERWLVNHIMVADRALADFLHRHSAGLPPCTWPGAAHIATEQRITVVPGGLPPDS